MIVKAQKVSCPECAPPVSIPKDWEGRRPEEVLGNACSEKSEMKNQNWLEGMRCPQCGSLEPFTICSEMFALVKDSGIYEEWAYEWAPTSFCRCEKCNFTGIAADFMEKEYDDPKFCPFCGKEIKECGALNSVSWEACSLDDHDNTCIIEEHQCHMCGLSFWT